MCVKVYSNSDVLKIIGFIPPSHRHMRLAIFFKDQTIVLQEATVAAIARTYLNIVAHPTKKAVECIQMKVDNRKPGYAEFQLIESSRSEEEIMKDVTTILKDVFDA
ncbi:MAG: hypothetical protein QXT53_04845 [Ignisphaera sp.]